MTNPKDTSSAGVSTYNRSISRLYIPPAESNKYPTPFPVSPGPQRPNTPSMMTKYPPLKTHCLRSQPGQPLIRPVQLEHQKTITTRRLNQMMSPQTMKYTQKTSIMIKNLLDPKTIWTTNLETPTTLRNRQPLLRTQKTTYPTSLSHHLPPESWKLKRQRTSAKRFSQQ